MRQRGVRRRRSSLAITRSVLFALLMREAKGRFGSLRLGYAWFIAEPLLHVMFFVVLFGFLLNSTLPNVHHAAFVACGVVMWELFSEGAMRGMNAVDANRGLIGFRNVYPFDLVAARCLLETLAQGLVLVLLLLGFAAAGWGIDLHAPLRALTAFAGMAALSLGMGLVLCALRTRMPEAAMLIPIVLRVAYFTSGIFYPLWLVPEPYAHYLSVLPMVHAIELLRAAFFAGYPLSHYISGWYLAGWALTLLVFGTALARDLRRRPLHG